MRRLTLSFVALSVLGGCATTESSDSGRFVEANDLMAEEIRSRISQIPFQHREELFNNLVWLSQAGEQAIPDLLGALDNDEPKVRSNAAWVLGQIGDRRVITDLQPLVQDANATVRLESARTLMTLGDMRHAPVLIQSLDSDKPEVRYLCHEALKEATGQDFGYDHLSENLVLRHQSVFGWRQWWTSMSGDERFSAGYAQAHGIALDEDEWGTGSHASAVEQPAAPMAEAEQPVQPEPEIGELPQPTGPEADVVAPEDEVFQPAPMTEVKPPVKSPAAGAIQPENPAAFEIEPQVEVDPEPVEGQPQVTPAQKTPAQETGTSPTPPKVEAPAPEESATIEFEFPPSPAPVQKTPPQVPQTPQTPTEHATIEIFGEPAPQSQTPAPNQPRG